MPDDANVLWVVTDQERADLADPGAPAVRTPACDRLAGEGVRFDRAYTPTAICSPARVSLLTGLYPHNHGVLSNPTRSAVETGLPPDVPAVGERVADAGYETGYVGKWHVADSDPADAGFERLTGWEHTDDGTLDTDDYRSFVREQGVDPDEVTVERTGAPGGAAVVDLPPDATQTAYLAERAIARLERHATADERFCLRLDFPGPHTPYVVPREYADRYDPGEIDPWPSYAETFDGKPAVHELHPAYYGSDDLEWNDWAESAAHYFAFAELVEDQFVRVLDALDDLGLAADTAVVRTSDHGEFVGHHRQGNKGPLAYEDIYRVPLYVRWPDAVEGGTVVDDTFVELQDLAATVCDLCGTDLPGSDARSLVPFLCGDRETHRDAAFAEYHGEPEMLYTQRVVRTDRYKFVYNGPDVNELYDLREDPHELNNLVDHPGYAGVRRSLAERLGDWMDETDDHVSVGRYRARCVD
jgi:arylsulfatase A-like enzyme